MIPGPGLGPAGRVHGGHSGCRGSLRRHYIGVMEYSLSRAAALSASERPSAGVGPGPGIERAVTVRPGRAGNTVAFYAAAPLRTD